MPEVATDLGTQPRATASSAKIRHDLMARVFWATRNELAMETIQDTKQCRVENAWIGQVFFSKLLSEKTVVAAVVAARLSCRT